MKTYVIKYLEDGNIEGATNNPNKWLELHNKQREQDGSKPEQMFEFEFIKVKETNFVQ